MLSESPSLAHFTATEVEFEPVPSVEAGVLQINVPCRLSKLHRSRRRQCPGVEAGGGGVPPGFVRLACERTTERDAPEWLARIGVSSSALWVGGVRDSASRL